MPTTILAVLGAVGPASLVISMIVMGLLSQRLGAVTKMPPYYRWFYVAAGLLGISTLLRLSALAEVYPLLAQLYTVTFALGLTLSVGVAWRYWGWLFGEGQ